MQLPSIALPRWKLAGSIAILSLGIAMLAGAAELGGQIASMSIILGWFILVPLVALLGSALPMVEQPETDDEEANDTDAAVTADPVDQLRERYARGELTDTEFERRLNRLLETESLTVSDERADHARETDRELSLETE